MPARVKGLYSAVRTFFGIRSKKLSPTQIDQLIVDSFNKSHESWVARGWVKKTTSVEPKVVVHRSV
jgi:hypothetical protein